MGALRVALAATALLLTAAAPPSAVPPAPTVRAGVEKWRANDYPAAVAIWVPFAAAGDADALFNMGQAYKLGRGVTANAATARDYYRRAALKGHLPAQANLGIALFQVGEKAESVKWLTTAADRGEARAQYVLGIAAFNGDGLPRSQALGYGYLLRAQAGGLPQARTALGSIEAGLSPTDRTAGEAVAASLAAGTGVPSALAAATGPRLLNSPAPPAAVVLRSGPEAAPPPAMQTAAAAPAAAPPVPKPAPIRTAPPPVVQAAATPKIDAPAPAPVGTAPPPPVPGNLAAAPPATLRPPPAVIATTEVPASRPVTASGIELDAKPAAPPPVKVVPPPPPVATASLKPFETIIPAQPAARKPDGWRVQLGAFSARKQADAAWAAAKADAGAAKPIFAADGPVVRLQMGPYPSREAARTACAKLSEAGRACFVTNG